MAFLDRLTSRGGVLQDLRYAWRQLRRAPGFASVAILTLALGIGGSIAFASLARALAFAPIPVARVDGLFAVTSVNRRLFVAVILIWYMVSAVYIAWLRYGRDVVLQARAQVLGDLAFATAVIYLTGGIDTTFNFLYPLVIILASILLSQSWAYVTAETVARTAAHTNAPRNGLKIRKT